MAPQQIKMRLAIETEMNKVFGRDEIDIFVPAGSTLGELPGFMADTWGHESTPWLLASADFLLPGIRVGIKGYSGAFVKLRVQRGFVTVSETISDPGSSGSLHSGATRGPMEARNETPTTDGCSTRWIETENYQVGRPVPSVLAEIDGTNQMV